MKRLRGSVLGIMGAAAAGLAACGKTENVSPSDVVVQFYVTIELSGIRDLPEPRALMALEPYLTDSLASALRRARALRDSAVVRTPGQTPPFAEGNLFSGFFEGHTTYVVRGATTRNDSSFVTVAFTNADQKPAVTWADTVVLTPTPGTASASNRAPAPVWRIADLRYGGNWEFGYRGSLQQVLTQALTQALTQTP